eukprot:1160390-Pelagomonas_calceolata.AAC.12
MEAHNGVIVTDQEHGPCMLKCKGFGTGCPVKHQAQSSLTPYMPSAEKQDAVNKGLLCFIITSESPFRELNNKRKGGRLNKAAFVHVHNTPAPEALLLELCALFSEFV